MDIWHFNIEGFKEDSKRLPLSHPLRLQQRDAKLWRREENSCRESGTIRMKCPCLNCGGGRTFKVKNIPKHLSKYGRHPLWRTREVEDGDSSDDEWVAAFSYWKQQPMEVKFPSSHGARDPSNVEPPMKLPHVTFPTGSIPADSNTADTNPADSNPTEASPGEMNEAPTSPEAWNPVQRNLAPWNLPPWNPPPWSPRATNQHPVSPNPPLWNPGSTNPPPWNLGSSNPPPWNPGSTNPPPWNPGSTNPPPWTPWNPPWREQSQPWGSGFPYPNQWGPPSWGPPPPPYFCGVEAPYPGPPPPWMGDGRTWPMGPPCMQGVGLEKEGQAACTEGSSARPGLETGQQVAGNKSWKDQAVKCQEQVLKRYKRERRTSSPTLPEYHVECSTPQGFGNETTQNSTQVLSRLEATLERIERGMDGLHAKLEKMKETQDEMTGKVDRMMEMETLHKSSPLIEEQHALASSSVQVVPPIPMESEELELVLQKIEAPIIEVDQRQLGLGVSYTSKFAAAMARESDLDDKELEGNQGDLNEGQLDNIALPVKSKQGKRHRTYSTQPELAAVHVDGRLLRSAFQ